MHKHPCRNGPQGQPCCRVRLGQPYDSSQDCRLCWLFVHHAGYNLAWGGDGKITVAPATSVVFTPSASLRHFQLGDLIESTLTKVGVTKGRIEEWLGRPCGCKERQKRLNELSAWAQQVGEETMGKAREWLSRVMGSS